MRFMSDVTKDSLYDDSDAEATRLWVERVLEDRGEFEPEERPHARPVVAI